jgi:hypothetical protein
MLTRQPVGLQKPGGAPDVPRRVRGKARRVIVDQPKAEMAGRLTSR